MLHQNLKAGRAKVYCQIHFEFTQWDDAVCKCELQTDLLFIALPMIDVQFCRIELLIYVGNCYNQFRLHFILPLQVKSEHPFHDKWSVLTL